MAFHGKSDYTLASMITSAHEHEEEMDRFAETAQALLEKITRTDSEIYGVLAGTVGIGSGGPNDDIYHKLRAARTKLFADTRCLEKFCSAYDTKHRNKDSWK